MRNIFIYGYYGCGNLGDDAMLCSLIRHMHKLYPKRQFHVLAKKRVILPKDINEITKFIPRKIPVVLYEAFKSSCFILGGGTHFYDYGRRIKWLKPMCMTLIFLLWPWLIRKPILFLGIGISPLSTKLGNILVKALCFLPAFISVRDSVSYGILKRMGISKARISVGFDLTGLLAPRLTEKLTEKKILIEKGKVLGISLLPVFYDYFRDCQKDNILIENVSLAVSYWLRTIPKGEVILFSFFNNQSRQSDRQIVKKLYNKFKGIQRVKIIKYENNPIIFLTIFFNCDTFIVMRLHAAIFAYLSGSPFILINYHPKCMAFAKDVGLLEYAIMNIEDVKRGDLLRRIELLYNKREFFRAKLPINLAINKALDLFKFKKSNII